MANYIRAKEEEGLIYLELREREREKLGDGT